MAKRMTLGDFIASPAHNVPVPISSSIEGYRIRDVDQGAEGEVQSLTITATKKGSLPIGIEKRAKGKKVTVLKNLRGDKEQLLKALKDAIGAGGSVQGDQIELQGEHPERVEAFLRREYMHCMVNVQGTKPSKTPKASAAAPSDPSSTARRVAATPGSKDQKLTLVKIQKAMDKAFCEEHQLEGKTGNQLAKMKYSDFVAVWQAFCAGTNDVAWKVVTGRS